MALSLLLLNILTPRGNVMEEEFRDFFLPYFFLSLTWSNHDNRPRSCRLWNVSFFHFFLLVDVERSFLTRFVVSFSSTSEIFINAILSVSIHLITCDRGTWWATSAISPLISVPSSFRFLYSKSNNSETALARVCVYVRGSLFLTPQPGSKENNWISCALLAG